MLSTTTRTTKIAKQNSEYNRHNLYNNCMLSEQQHPNMIGILLLV